MTRTSHRCAAVAAAGALAVLLAGCSMTAAPIVLDAPAAGEGTSADLRLPDRSVVQLRNFVVVSDDLGRPAEVVGAVGYDGSRPVEVTLGVEPADSGPGAEPAGTPSPDGAATPTTEGSAEGPEEGSAGEPAAEPVVLRVPAGGLAQVGPAGGQTRMRLAAAPVPPGALLVLVATTPSGGSVRWTVPVLTPTGHYASLTAPAGSPSASPTS